MITKNAVIVSISLLQIFKNLKCVAFDFRFMCPCCISVIVLTAIVLRETAVVI